MQSSSSAGTLDTQERRLLQSGPFPMSWHPSHTRCSLTPLACKTDLSLTSHVATGICLSWFEGTVNASAWTGTRQSCTLLTQAQDHEPCQPLARADAADLPIANSSLGAVLCHYALMLLQPLETVLANWERILRRGGLLSAVPPRAPARRHRIRSQCSATHGSK